MSHDEAHPLITIGMTCFNAEDTITRAVQGALTQDWPNTEIVVVDDHSSDNSWAILQVLSEGHRSVRLVRHSINKGYPAALNTILGAANGEFVAIFDDDDQSRTDRLTLQFARLRNYEASCGQPTPPVLCYSNRCVVGPLSPTQAQENPAPGTGALAIGRQPPEPNGPMVADFVLAHIRDLRHTWGLFGTGTMMARRSVLQHFGGFDERFRRSAEWDLVVRAAFEHTHFIAVDEPLVTTYKTPTADKSGTIPLQYALALRYKYKEYLLEKRLFWAALCQARARFYYARGMRFRERLLVLASCIAAPTQVLPSVLLQRAQARQSKKQA